nr:hypothetical protein K3N28_12310 [Glycomyces sp. TRM65418]
MFAAVAAVALLAAACTDEASGDDVASVEGGGSETTAEAEQDVSREEAMVNYAGCMRDNGVEEFPDPGGNGLQIGPEIVDDPEFEAAQEACQDELPDQGAQPGPEQQEAMVEFSGCMRDNGVEEFPDLTGGGGIKIGPEIAQDPEFEAAMEACQEIIEEMHG